MSRFASIFGFLALFVSCFIGYSRWSLSKLKRSSNHELEWIPNSNDDSQALFKIVTRSTDTNGEYMVMHEIIRPYAEGNPFVPKNRTGGPPPHIHPTQTETFTCLEGRMGYTVGDFVGVLEPGQSAVVPPGAVHTFFNAVPSQELRIAVKLEPSMDADVMLEQAAGAARDFGRPSKMPPLLTLAILKTYHVVPAFVPKPVWAVLQHIVVPLCQLLGHDVYRHEYTPSLGGRVKSV